MSFAEQLTRLQAFLDADELHEEALDYVAAHGYPVSYTHLTLPTILLV